jgi:hypothetical protein
MSTSFSDDSPRGFLICGIFPAWDSKGGSRARVMAIGRRDLKGWRAGGARAGG